MNVSDRNGAQEVVNVSDWKLSRHDRRLLAVSEPWASVVQMARAARLRSGQLTEPFSTRRIVETLFPAAVVAGGQLPSRVQEAVSIRHEGPVILYSRDLEPPDQRFVIAHAIAHLLYDGNADGAGVGFVGDPMREERADAFAAELLVPLARLDAVMDPDISSSGDLHLDEIDRLASRFNVPRWLIRKRVQDLADRRT